MRDVIYFMNLIDEMKNFGITLPGVPTPTTTACCVFCNSQILRHSGLEPKHLAVQLHHFWQYILDKKIAVEKVDTKYQRADIMTKALPKDSFQFLCKTITGW